MSLSTDLLFTSYVDIPYCGRLPIILKLVETKRLLSPQSHYFTSHFPYFVSKFPAVQCRMFWYKQQKKNPKNI